MPEYDLHPVLDFTAALKQNNNRPWFMEHHADYESARVNFEAFITNLIAEHSKTEPLDGVTPKDCIFRLNRDLRFTKDKTPYKPFMSAYIAPGGRKSRLLGYYVHLEPGNSMLAGGMYEPETQQLSAFREAIHRNSQPFREIIARPDFKKYFGSVGGERLKTIPRGFPVDHPDADLLRMKSVSVTRPLADTDVLAPEFFDATIETFKVMKPFLSYLENFIR